MYCVKAEFPWDVTLCSLAGMQRLWRPDGPKYKSWHVCDPTAQLQSAS